MDVSMKRMCETHQFENNHKWQNGDSGIIGSKRKKTRKEQGERIEKLTGERSYGDTHGK